MWISPAPMDIGVNHHAKFGKNASVFVNQLPLLEWTQLTRQGKFELSGLLAIPPLGRSDHGTPERLSVMGPVRGSYRCINATKYDILFIPIIVS